MLYMFMGFHFSFVTIKLKRCHTTYAFEKDYGNYIELSYYYAWRISNSYSYNLNIESNIKRIYGEFYLCFFFCICL